MKKRVLTFDFTSLLDVIMIILFFFILFSRFDLDKAQNQAEQNMQEAKATQSQAEQMMNEAESLQKDVEQQLAILEEADQNAAAMAEALDQYRKNENISLILQEENNTLYLFIKQGKECTQIEQITRSAVFDSFVKAGYQRDDIILCDFIYNSNGAGTKSAIKDTIRPVLDEAKRDFKNLYVSETDLNLE